MNHIEESNNSCITCFQVPHKGIHKHSPITLLQTLSMEVQDLNMVKNSLIKNI